MGKGPKVRSIAQGTIKVDDMITKQLVETEINKLDHKEIMQAISSFPVVNDVVTLTPDIQAPEILVDLQNLVKTLFNIGNEVTKPMIRLFLPPTNANSNLFLERPPVGTGARIVVNAGATKEVFTLGASAGGRQGEGKVLIIAKCAFLIRVEYCSAIEISANNGKFDSLPPKAGHRALNIKKNPEQRLVIAFDFPADVAQLMKAIKGEASAISGGDEAKAEEITKKFSQAMGLGSVDAAINKSNVEEYAPVENKIKEDN